jgi:nitroreductase
VAVPRGAPRRGGVHPLARHPRPGEPQLGARRERTVLVAAQTVDDTGRSRPWALFDTGQAVAALSVQAEADGLSVHQMGGFDADAARNEFDLEEALTPLVVLAVGRRDPNAELPEPLAARERAPRSREPLQALMLTAPEDPTRRVA